VVKHSSHRVERHVADSLDDLPPEIRERVDQLRRAGGAEEHHSVFTIKDGDGQERTYHSFDEMPPDVRAMFESSSAMGGARKSRSVGGPLASRRRRDASGLSVASGTVPGRRLAFWLGGVLVAGLLVGLGLSGLVSLEALGGAEAKGGNTSGFLGLPIEGTGLRLVALALAVVGGALHFKLVWLNPVGRRFYAVRMFVTVTLAAFLFANLGTLARLFGAYSTVKL
jgi:hypothetical protein